MEEKKRIPIAVPTETNETIEKLSKKMDEPKGKVIKQAVEMFAKKIL